MSELTVEWAPFELTDGTTEDELRAASATLQSAFLENQDGFIRRELLRADERHWCDLVYWRSPDAARLAMANAAESPVCYRYFKLMVPADADPGAGVRHFTIGATYGRSDPHGSPGVGLP